MARSKLKAGAASLGAGAAAAALAYGLQLDPLLFAAVIMTVMFVLYRFLSVDSAKARPPLPLKPRAPVPRPMAGDDDRIGISALADPALVVSEGWRVLAANAGAIALFGPRVQGSDLRQTVRHPTVVEAVRQGILGANPVQREVTTLGQRDGAFGVRLVRLDDGRLLLTFSDITQTRLTERMRVDFVANASHELRTPLANITGFIETLLGPAAEDEPARRRFLDIMAREAARMSRLIDDLLSLSRIELDKYVRPQLALDLPPLLLDVGKTLAMRLEEDDRKLLLEVADGLPQVIADRDQILQVLHNLVSNALKYGRSGSPITVQASPVLAERRGDDMVRVAVVDRGEGIAPEHLPRLTERFYRIDNSRSRQMGGTGLGLAIVKHIVERHRGKLEIASVQGEGTTVSFLLPVAQPIGRMEDAASADAGFAAREPAAVATERAADNGKRSTQSLS